MKLSSSSDSSIAMLSVMRIMRGVYLVIVELVAAMAKVMTSVRSDCGLLVH
jgi:hypothetical protein